MCVCVFGGLFFIYTIFSSDFSYNLDEIYYTYIKMCSESRKCFVFFGKEVENRGEFVNLVIVSMESR